MNEEFIKKIQEMSDSAEAVYFEVTKKYKVVMMWDEDEKFIPLTSQDIGEFEKSFGATQSSVKSAFAACDRLAELLKEIRYDLGEKERKLEQLKYHQSGELDTEYGDFRTDAEREAGIPKKGYF